MCSSLSLPCRIGFQLSDPSVPVKRAFVKRRNLDIRSTETYHEDALAPLKEEYGMCNTPASSLGEQASFRHADQQRLGIRLEQGDPQNALVPQLVAAQAAAVPDARAVMQGKLSLTYHELDQRANQLAHFLQSLGVGPDVVVGLYLDRSLAVIVGALAILKAGGAYLPLDPSYPKERLMVMLKDAKTPILVTGQCMADQLPEHPEHIVTLDPEGRLPVTQSSEPPVARARGENLAYVIYTSGSTGQPKGVQNHSRRQGKSAIGSRVRCRCMGTLALPYSGSKCTSV